MYVLRQWTLSFMTRNSIGATCVGLPCTAARLLTLHKITLLMQKVVSLTLSQTHRVDLHNLPEHFAGLPYI